MRPARTGRRALLAWRLLLLVALFVAWYLLTAPGLLPNFLFDEDHRAAFFFGEPLVVLGRIRDWFTGVEIWRHLGVTLLETVLAFAIDLARPRDVAEVRATPRFVELHQAIWSVLREEVLAGYRQQLAA